MSRPNIVYIHSHDTGRYIQPYGHGIPTPRLQRLAEEGILFRQAFCAAPTCSPSRAALLTGQSAHQSGMLGLVHRGFSLKDPSQHLATALRNAGYSTTLCGVQHEAADPLTLGYQRILPAESRLAQDVAPAVADFLKSKPAEPFFLTVGFFETHRHSINFTKGEPVGDPRYVRPPAPLPDLPEIRRDMADYIESANDLDTGVGIVLDALDSAGLADNTLVISTTDHGIPFVGMKSYLTDHGMGVSLILRGPGTDGGADATGGFRGGRVVDAMVSHVDIYPTVCELARIDRPPWLTGRSLLPLLRDNASPINDEVFAEVNFHSGYDPQRAVRTSRWKYIRRFHGHRHAVLCNSDDASSKNFLLTQGLRDRQFDDEQLYDLLYDPNEAHNLAPDPPCSAVLAEMRQRLDQWMRRTNDPLLAGPVPAPPGSLISDPTDISPNDIRRRTNAPPAPPA